ncbi:hypothetical protein J1614_006674 [Plenodomus biglobosus]|nr:hypothetical protein J1614_006674 [Plenodomus biglobosus]
MSYGLRAKTDLKRPQRYSQASAVNDGTDSIRPTANAGSPFASFPRADSHHTEALPPTPQRPFTSSPVALHTTAAPPGPAPAQVFRNAGVRPRTQAEIMPPNIKQVRKNKRPREDEQSGDYDVAGPSRRPSTRPRRHSVESPSAVPSIYPSLTPSAFPTKSGTPPPSKDARILSVEGQQYARHMTEAREACDQRRIEECERVVDRLYACSSSMDKYTAGDLHQSAWYRQLKERWVADNNPAEVTFASLWPSLRQVIIERVRDEFAARSYHDPYHPVQAVLGLSRSQLTQIIADNSEVWNFAEDIPVHLREYKRLHPQEAVDPEMPPPHEVVRAIKYLKQNHLAGNLLGEWQMPLPSTEVFASFARESVVPTLGSDHGTGPRRASHSQPLPVTTGRRQLTISMPGTSQASSQGQNRYEAAGSSGFTSQNRKLDASAIMPPTPKASQYYQSLTWNHSELASLAPMYFPRNSSPPRNGSKKDYPFRYTQLSRGSNAQHLGLKPNAEKITGIRLSLGDETLLYPIAERITCDSNEQTTAWLANGNRIDTACLSGSQYVQNSILNKLAQGEDLLERSIRAANRNRPNMTTGIPYPAFPSTRRLRSQHEIQQPSSGFIHNGTHLPYSEVDRMFTEGDDYIPPSARPQLRRTADTKQPPGTTKGTPGGKTPKEQADIKKRTTEMYRDLCIPLDQRQPTELKHKKPKTTAGQTVARSAPAQADAMQASTTQSAIAQTHVTPHPSSQTDGTLQQRIGLSTSQNATPLLRQDVATTTPLPTALPRPHLAISPFLAATQTTNSSVPIANMYSYSSGSIARPRLSIPPSPFVAARAPVHGPTPPTRPPVMNQTTTPVILSFPVNAVSLPRAQPTTPNMPVAARGNRGTDATPMFRDDSGIFMDMDVEQGENGPK